MTPPPRRTRPPADLDLDSLDALELEVANLRERAFALCEAAQLVLGHGFGDVHVRLQTAANELGELERLFARAGWP